ncbi:MAG: FlgD immunoglobulin-like domain containing protein [Hyphomicrobiales bacterium]
MGTLAQNGNYTATLSGTVINNASATSTWFLYPGACQQRALGTWAPATAIVADSLDTYATGTAGSYVPTDLSLKEKLWHVVTSAVDPAQRPTILNGTGSLWCGKYDANWVVKVGYPNLTYQILYIDTGAHAANYALTFKQNQSSEQNYDYVYLIGGDPTIPDAMGNLRSKFDEAISSGSSGGSNLLVAWTGSIQVSTPGATSISVFPASIVGSGTAQPDAIVPVTVNMNNKYRDLYFLFYADCLFSNEDGLWPLGHGCILDDVSTSDNGAIFTDGTAPTVGTDGGYSGTELQGTYGSQGYIAARVAPGTGELWQIVDGGFAATADNCSLQKNDTADHFFFGVDAGTKKTIPGQYNTVVSCTFPVPAGAASILANWGEYLDLPRGAGYVQETEFRYFKDGSWTGWINSSPSGGVITSVIKTWVVDGNELAAAVQADSVQVRYDLQCIPAFATDRVNCGQVDYGIMYDDLYLRVLTGIPAPLLEAFPSAVPQSMFVDGTMTGLNCTVTPCWPGIRGSDLSGGIAVKDNFNSPYGDSTTVGIATGLRKNGMGVNWKHAYSKSTADGGRILLAGTNAGYNASFDTPRAIFRIFDPATLGWSPWDSTELPVDNLQVSGIDSVVTSSSGAPEFRLTWPPFDKVGQNLPGGFTINGVAGYSQLAFLPRGTRVQYYFKAVDINGGQSYVFSTSRVANEVEDLPTLPGSANIAPDIIEFDVLPRKYAAGHAGTLLAGKSNTPVLNLDGAYSNWDYGQDPVTQALRGLGVRADRYRLTQGLDNADNIGGHELTGPPDSQRPGRLSNYFPNLTEYGIKDSLAKWYTIMIQSAHDRTATLENESDARLLEEWWATDTGTNGGDRCLFVSGDDYFNALDNVPAGNPVARRNSYSQNVLGVNSSVGAWNGTASNAYPTVEDRFANPGAGPGLVAGYTYPVDGGCPGPNRFDALTKVGLSTAQNSAFYPLFSGVTDVAAVANMTERDPVTDNDRNKALGYGFSIQFIRKAGIPTGAANYVRSGVQERMQVLYKFLASCRGPRSGAPADTAKCWPCPTDANMTGNWATLTGFQTGSYGPLYAIQDNLAATGVEVSDASEAPKVNRLEGNFPNPFNPQTTIKFTAAQAGKVTLRIFNVGGQLVRTLSTKAEAGANEVRWNGKRDDGAQLASGVYFYKIKFADGSETGSRMALVK